MVDGWVGDGDSFFDVEFVGAFVSGSCYVDELFVCSVLCKKCGLFVYVCVEDDEDVFSYFVDFVCFIGVRVLGDFFWVVVVRVSVEAS